VEPLSRHLLERDKNIPGATGETSLPGTAGLRDDMHRILPSSRKAPVAVQGRFERSSLSESVDTEPFHPMPSHAHYGSAVSTSELCYQNLRWAGRLGTPLLTRIFHKFAPYNAIIRVLSERGTEG